MGPHVKAATLLIIVTASSAHAWEVFIRVSLEVTCRGTSETSSAASSASDRDARRQERLDQYSQSSDCRTDSDCQVNQYCEQGRCVQPMASAPVPQTQPLPGCSDDSQCAIGYACLNTQCVQRTAPQLPAVNVVRCETYLQCGPGQSCVGGQCMSPPPSPPSSSIQRRGTEVYLRERSAQLRQDLALGEGPVISNLALQHQVTPRKLGLIMRAHRAELSGLVGDGADTAWPGRFLEKVDQLLAPKSAAATAAETETAG
jgi:hypothetical protein